MTRSESPGTLPLVTAYGICRNHGSQQSSGSPRPQRRSGQSAQRIRHDGPETTKENRENGDSKTLEAEEGSSAWSI